MSVGVGIHGTRGHLSVKAWSIKLVGVVFYSIVGLLLDYFTARKKGEDPSG